MLDLVHIFRCCEYDHPVMCLDLCVSMGYSDLTVAQDGAYPKAIGKFYIA